MGSHHYRVIFQLLTLLFLCSCPFIEGAALQSPSSACAGESINVSCVLTVPNAGAGDAFDSSRPSFIIGLTNVTVSEAAVIGTGTANGFDLSRFTAASNPGSLTEVSGLITLLSYINNTDEGLRMGCGSDYRAGGGSPIILVQALTLVQAELPSTPDNFTSEKCFGVKLSWIAPATDRALIQYYLYRNSSLISTLSSTTTQHIDTDLPILNTAYQYSLSAASCAGNSTPATIKIPVPDNNFRIRLKVSDNSLIEPGLTSITTSVPLSFNFTLYNNNIANETLSNISYSDLNSHSFMAKFVCDVCYRMTASVLTCSDQVKEVTSKHFILPGVRNGDGSFQNVSTLSSHRIAWIYEFDSPLCSGSDLEEYYFISKNYFEFSLYRNETQASVPITEFDLNFPLNFTFIIPPSIDISKEIILLRILFNGNSFTKEDIVLYIPPPLDPLPPPSSTITIILICLFIFLLILLGIVVALIIIFLYIRWLKKPGEKKKMCPCLCIREEKHEEEKRPI